MAVFGRHVSGLRFGGHRHLGQISPLRIRQRFSCDSFLKRYLFHPRRYNCGLNFWFYWIAFLKLVAACAFGLESPVKWELKVLGYEPKVISPGRVQFEGDWSDVCKANLWLRIADRVLIEVARFDAPDFDALFETIKAMEWQQWLPRDAKFPVTARTRNSQLTSLPAIQRSSKKAIVESLQKAYDTAVLPETGGEFRIDVVLLDDEATLNLDTSGASLHKRGYRTSFGEAPIKETLAAAMVSLSVWRAERPFLDPFCGSGTIPIEAAMIARNIAPGLNRTFSWETWPHINSDVAQQLRAEARDAITENIELQLIGTDKDADVLKSARANAEKAGVADDIHFQQKTFEELRSKRQYGCLITNPPYGERLGERKRLLPLYQSIPAVLQRLPTWSHFIITNFPSFEGLVQKSATRRRKLFNGRIECMYYQFLGPKPGTADQNDAAIVANSEHVTDHSESALAASENQTEPKPESIVTQSNDNTSNNTLPLGGSGFKPGEGNQPQTPTKPSHAPVFGGLHDKDQEQASLFATRLQKRARHLRRWPTKRGITCFRLYERDIPELPFVVDRYENHFHITEYERPHDRDPGRHAAWLELMKKTVAKTFDVPIKQIHLKTRRRQKGTQQHERQSTDSKKVIVNEGGLKFLINLSDYVDTGLFLDHRATRQMVRDEAAGKKFLNLFAYTGSFSVYAAAGGAASTTTVDWSSTYQDWSRENMALNGFDTAEHVFCRQGAVEFFDSLGKDEKFDLAVVDPPTFSNSKRTDNVWDVQRDYAELLNKLSDHLVSQGVVYFSNNFRTFELDEALLPEFDCREITSQTLPEEFRNRRIHRCWKLIRK